MVVGSVELYSGGRGRGMWVKDRSWIGKGGTRRVRFGAGGSRGEGGTVYAIYLVGGKC